MIEDGLSHDDPPANHKAPRFWVGHEQHLPPLKRRGLGPVSQPTKGHVECLIVDCGSPPFTGCRKRLAKRSACPFSFGACLAIEARNCQHVAVRIRCNILRKISLRRPLK